MTQPKYNTLNTITVDGVEYSFAVSLKQIAEIEKKHNKKLGELIVSQQADVVIDFTKHALMQGFINRKIEVPQNVEDLSIKALDSVDGLFADVLNTYDTALAKMFKIEKEGNQPASNSEAQ